MEKCHFCNREFNTNAGLLRHVYNTHKMKSLDYKVLTEYNGVWPTCKCGCGEKVNWSAEFKRFNDYKRGHIARIHNNWGHNKKAIENSTKTRKKLASEGKWKVWNDGKSYEELKGKEWSDTFIKQIVDDKERAKKISKSLTGKSKSEEHKIKIRKTLQRNRENLLIGTSKLEDHFSNMLSDLGIKHTRQFQLENFYYDFKINDKNILIETDGDYWHGNPNKYKKGDLITFPGSTTILVEDVWKRDEYKSKIALEHGYTLLRFWENDIINHPAKVVKKLLNEIKI